MYRSDVIMNICNLLKYAHTKYKTAFYFLISTSIIYLVCIQARGVGRVNEELVMEPRGGDV